MNDKGYVIFNKDFSDEQKCFIQKNAQNYSLSDNNVLVLKGETHYLSLKEIIDQLLEPGDYEFEEDYLCDNGAILILNHLDTYNHYGTKQGDIQIPTDINLISKKQIESFKNFFQIIYNYYDIVMNLGDFPKELSQELIMYPEILNLEDSVLQIKEIYKLFIYLCEENLKEKIK